MKTNYLLSKGYRYFVRLSGAGIPVLSSMVARKTPPRRSNGTWTDITSCLTGCCGVTLTALDTTIGIDTETGSILELAGIVSSSGDTLSVTPVDINGVVTINTDGTFEITETVENYNIIVIVADQHGNSITIFVAISVTVE